MFVLISEKGVQTLGATEAAVRMSGLTEYLGMLLVYLGALRLSIWSIRTANPGPYTVIIGLRL